MSLLRNRNILCTVLIAEKTAPTVEFEPMYALTGITSLPRVSRVDKIC